MFFRQLTTLGVIALVSTVIGAAGLTLVLGSAVQLSRVESEYAALLVAASVGVTELLILRVDLNQRLSSSLEEVVALSQNLESSRTELRRLGGIDELNAKLVAELEEARTLEIEQVRVSSSLKAEVERLESKASNLESQLKDITSRLETTSASLRTSEEKAVAAASQLAELTQALNNERLTTQRAPFIPLLDVALRLEGFGILSPKRVVVEVTNKGPGNAVDVELSTAPQKSGLGALDLTPQGFWPSLVRGESRQARIGDASEFGQSGAVRVKVSYGSQFGPRAPIEMTFALR